MPHSEEFLDENVLNFDGLTENPVLVGAIVTMIGQEVEVETKDGSKFHGIFSACGPQVKQIGLSYAYKLPGKGYENYVLCKPDAMEKMVFDFSDVVEITHVVHDNFTKKFLTDKEYNACNGDKFDLEEDLQEWDGGDEIFEEFPHDDHHDGSGGWSVDAMFKENREKHGTTTDYNDDLSQYTTVRPHGTEEEKRRAERIAAEIEQSNESKRRAMLENDDEERDLDKETNFDKEGFESVQSRGKGRRNNYNNSKNSMRRNENDGLNQNPNEFRMGNNSGRGNRSGQNRQMRQYAEPRNTDNFNRPTDMHRQNSGQKPPMRRLESPGTNVTRSSEVSRGQREFNTSQRTSQNTRRDNRDKTITDLATWRKGFNIQINSPDPVGTSHASTPTTGMAEMSIASSSSVLDGSYGNQQMQSIQTVSRQPNAWQNGPPETFRQPGGKSSSQYPALKKNESPRDNEQSGINRRSSHQTSPTSFHDVRDPIEPPSKSSQMPKVESMPSIPSNTASTSNLAATEVTSIVEPASSTSATTTDAQADKLIEKAPLSTTDSTSNLSDAATAGSKKIFVFNPHAPSFVPKKDLPQVASSPAPVMNPMMTQPVPIPITPAMPPPVIGQPPTVFYQPYGVPHPYIAAYPQATAVQNAQAISASQPQPLAQTTVQPAHPMPSQTPSGSTSSSGETTNVAPSNGVQSAQIYSASSAQTQAQQSFNPNLSANSQVQSRISAQPSYQPSSVPNQYIPGQQTIQYQAPLIQGQYPVMPPVSVMGQPPVMMSYGQVPYGVPNPMYSYPPTGPNAQAIASSRQTSQTPPVHATHQSYPMPSQTPSGTSTFGGEVQANMSVSNSGQPYTSNIQQQAQAQAYNPGMNAPNRFAQAFQQQGQVPNPNLYIAPQINPYQQPTFVQGQYQQGQIIYPVNPNQYMVFQPVVQPVNPTTPISNQPVVTNVQSNYGSQTPHVQNVGNTGQQSGVPNPQNTNH